MKKILAFALTLIMAVGCLPSVVFADDNMIPSEDEPVVTQEQTAEEESLQEPEAEQGSVTEQESSQEPVVEQEPLQEQLVESDIPETTKSEEILMPLASVKSKNADNGILISWNSTSGSPLGYKIYRKTNSGEWDLLATTKYTMYTDSKISYTGEVEYIVAPYYTNSDSYKPEISRDDQILEVIWVNKPSKISAKSLDAAISVNWEQVEGSDGYILEYARNPLFNNAKTLDIEGEGNTSKEVVVSSDTYYFRVKAYVDKDGTKTYSSWTSSLKKGFSIKVGYKNILKGNLYSIAVKNTGTSGYTVIQGGCQNGGYLYYLLQNSKSLKSIVVKIRISDGKIVKKSGAIDAKHGNSMTFNTKTHQIVIANTDPKAKQLSIMNPNTLKVTKKVTYTFPKDVFAVNTSKNLMKSYMRLSAISYYEPEDCYVGVLRDPDNTMVVFDSNFKISSAISMNRAKASNCFYQDMLMTEDYILLCESANANTSSSTYKSCKNILAVYNHVGEYMGELVTSNRYEIENVNYYNGSYYVAYHTSHYTDKVSWKYVKKVKKTRSNYKKYNKGSYKTVVSGKNYKVYKKSVKKHVFERIGFITRMLLN